MASTASETITTRDAARALGVDTSTVRRLADRGELASFRLTPRSPRRYRIVDVLRLVERAIESA